MVSSMERAAVWSHWRGWQDSRKPSCSPVASRSPSSPLQRAVMYFTSRFIALCRYATEIFGVVCCMGPFCCTPLYLLSLFLLCCTQPLAFRSCIAEDGLNFSLFLILHFQLGFPAIRQLEAYFQVPAVPVTYQRLNFWLHVCSIARAKVADSNQSCSY